MSGVNKVIIVGFLGGNPEMRSMPNGDAVTNVSIATSETWIDKKFRGKERKNRMASRYFLSQTSRNCRAILKERLISLY